MLSLSAKLAAYDLVPPLAIVSPSMSLNGVQSARQFFLFRISTVPWLCTVIDLLRSTGSML